MKEDNKCKFCGRGMDSLCYPKYSQSDTINDQCSCGAHRYGKRDGEVKWYTKAEWEDFVNIIDGVDWRKKWRAA